MLKVHRALGRSFEAFGTPARLPRELDRRSDQGQRPADGQWVIVQLARILRALGVFAVKLPTDLNRMQRPSVGFRDRLGTQSEN
jgi:hypothetical protein